MEARFVTDDLPATLREYAEDPAVAGLLVLAANGAVADISALDSAVRDISVPVFGGRFPGVLFEGERRGDGAVVVALSVEPSTTVVTDLSDPGTDIRPQLRTKVATPGETTAFVFVDGHATRIGRFVERLFERYGVECRFLGGGAGGLSEDRRPCVITDDGVLPDAAVLATVPVPSELGVNHGWREIAGPYRVNDAEGTTLSTLGAESAVDVYRRVVEADSGRTLTRENFFDIAKSYPFGISRLHGERIVRDPFKLTDDGGIRCFGGVPEGEYLHVLTGDKSSVIEAARTAATAAGPTDGGRLCVFDCISRVQYLADDFEADLDAIGGDGEPSFGALTIGEIANGDGGHLEYYNKTVVVARFRQL
jgi:hypothetical protein